MPLKTKNNRSHTIAHKKEKRTKNFLKVYHPYIPLLIAVLIGGFLFTSPEIRPNSNDKQVLSYATNVTDSNLLESTNKKRQASGLKPLSLNNDLDTAAQNKAEDMANRDYWSHDTPEGDQPWIFIDETPYRYKKAAENLAYGFKTSNSIVNGWMKSPSHRENILDRDVNDVGFGIINVPNYQSSGQQTLIVALYASPEILGSATSGSPSNFDKVNGQSTEQVSLSDSLTGESLPWITFFLGTIVGSLVVYISTKHALELRKHLKKRSKFKVKHPLLDVTLLAIAVTAFVASQTIGQIY